MKNWAYKFSQDLLNTGRSHGWMTWYWAFRVVGQYRHNKLTTETHCCTISTHYIVTQCLVTSHYKFWNGSKLAVSMLVNKHSLTSHCNVNKNSHWVFYIGNTYTTKSTMTCIDLTQVNIESLSTQFQDISECSLCR